jgi:hypothetical protein
MFKKRRAKKREEEKKRKTADHPARVHNPKHDLETR